jgi:hypothetical protein
MRPWDDDKKIEDRYVCIEASTIKNLNRNVNIQIEKGYKPIGGICYNNSVYCQALIK